MRLRPSAPNFAISSSLPNITITSSTARMERHIAVSSFFDRGLPREPLSLIVQSLSRRPDHFYAHSYVSPADLHAFGASSEAARSVSRQFFTAISTGLQSEDCEGCVWDPATADPGLLLSRDTDIHLLVPLLIQLGTAVQSLTIDTTLLRGVAWLDAMVSHACQIRELSLLNVEANFPLAEVLRATPKLSSLSVSSNRILQENHVHTLIHEAKHLECLSLAPIHCDNRLVPIWNSFPNLQKIGLATTQLPAITAGDYPDDDIFGGIAQGNSPRNIHTLNFGELRLCALKSLTALCGRIGAHLESLSFSLDWSIQANDVEGQLSLIKQYCPNVCIRLTCFPNVFVPAMEVLGVRLEAIQPTRSIFTETPAGLGHAAAAATRLKSITLTLCDSFAAEFLDKLLQPIGKHLHELRLTIYPEFEACESVPANSDIIDTVAKHCTSLRRIVLDRIRPNVCLQKIAQSNKNLLAVVAIIDSNIDIIDMGDTGNVKVKKEVGDWMAKIVRDFLYNCNNIVDITIEENEDGSIPPDNRIVAVDAVAAEFWGYANHSRNRNCDGEKKKIGIQIGQLYYEK